MKSKIDLDNLYKSTKDDIFLSYIFASMEIKEWENDKPIEIKKTPSGKFLYINRKIFDELSPVAQRHEIYHAFENAVDERDRIWNVSSNFPKVNKGSSERFKCFGK